KAPIGIALYGTSTGIPRLAVTCPVVERRNSIPKNIKYTIKIIDIRFVKTLLKRFNFGGNFSSINGTLKCSNHCTPTADPTIIVQMNNVLENSFTHAKGFDSMYLKNTCNICKIINIKTI